MAEKISLLKRLFERITRPAPSFLPRFESVDTVPTEKTAAFFRNGQMYKTQPENLDNWYDVDYIVSDSELFDLSNPDEILQIPVPSFRPLSFDANYGAKGSLDYVLRMIAGRNFDIRTRSICSACLWKSTQLMLSNDNFAWNKEDYERIIHWHYQLGMPEEAEKAKKYLQNFPRYNQNTFDYIAKKMRDLALKNAADFKSDLVYITSISSACCEHCAIFSNRVYSISGKNKRFPRLPDYALQHGNLHPGCKCSMTAFCGNENSLIMYRDSVTEAGVVSNRPFSDNRTTEEIELYKRDVETQREEEARRAKKAKDKANYETICYKFPQIAPKTFGAYMRMKNANSKSFQKIAQECSQHGLFIGDDTE